MKLRVISAAAAAALPWLCTCQGDAMTGMAPKGVLAIDLVDQQTTSGGMPVRYRMYGPGALATVPPSGPDLALKIYLSAPLSMGSEAAAPFTGLLVRDMEEHAAPARGFIVETLPDAAAPAGPSVPMTAQELTLTPDLRSGRSYTLRLDASQLTTDDGQSFQVPPVLTFETARRFQVVRADPPGSAPVKDLTQIRLYFSSPISPRISGQYGITLMSGNAPLAFTAAPQSGVGPKGATQQRQVLIETDCPLPLGTSTLHVDAGGLEELDTFNPLAQPFDETLTVQSDPGPCR